MSVLDRILALFGRKPTAPDGDGGMDTDREQRVRDALASAEQARMAARRLEMEARVFAGSPRRDEDP